MEKLLEITNTNLNFDCDLAVANDNTLIMISIDSFKFEQCVIPFDFHLAVLLREEYDDEKEEDYIEAYFLAVPEEKFWNEAVKDAVFFLNGITDITEKMDLGMAASDGPKIILFEKRYPYEQGVWEEMNAVRQFLSECKECLNDGDPSEMLYDALEERSNSIALKYILNGEML